VPPLAVPVNTPLQILLQVKDVVLIAGTSKVGSAIFTVNELLQPDPYPIVNV
jgi:hypothetical protein